MLSVYMAVRVRPFPKLPPLEALEDTLVRVSHLAMHIEGHLAELDINSLMVLPSGQGVKAVDALVVFRDK
jgi:hypothetical protein